jgi:DNA-binding transcriptional LysR family regulator
MADSVQSILDRANDNTPGPVVICARDGIGSYWLARRLPDLLQRKPDVRVSFRILPITPSLLDGEGDIAIQFEPPAAANVVAKPLGWLHYIPYAAPSYLARHGEPESMFDLKAHRCLRLSAEGLQLVGGSPVPAWDAILPSTMETNAGTVLMEACASGAGIAALPSYVSQCDSGLVPLTHIKPLASFKFWLAYTERVRNTAACAPILQWIRDCFDPISHPCFREAYYPPRRENDEDLPPRSML